MSLGACFNLASRIEAVIQIIWGQLSVALMNAQLSSFDDQSLEAVAITFALVELGLVQRIVQAFRRW